MNKVRAILRSERGDITSLSVTIGILVALMLLIVLIEAFGYGRTHNKLQLASNDTLDLMKAQNGFDAKLRSQFYDFAELQGLERSKVTVNATTGPVQRGQIVEIHAKTQYTFVALRPLGQEITMDVNVSLSGLASTFLRN
ncbi:hypothetical protein J6TS7_20810 [Paenibacillus dendritiformis]|uniref:DUF4320 family protein n=1 Tax=Paenibacillus TaxID=44249 RepID=UPI001B0C9C49|nr:DUF4320 family protein [Paenibacillus dendritiformis]GIO78471.1 hypothetical protein J6TS7_20810 [Paenibacillus dendritiformis]